MGEHPLDGAQAKIQRGGEHRKTLRAEIDAFLKAQPYPVIVDLDPQSGWHIARLRVLREPPLRLSIIAGEIAYEYVSALNHIVWYLGERKLRKKVWKYRNGVQLPITTSPESFAERPLVCKKYVSKPALAVIEALQPYNGRDGQPGAIRHPLWLMKEVADSDKHRVLAPRITQFRINDIEFAWDPSLASGPEIEYLLSPGQRLYDGTELARVRFATGNEDSDVHVERQLSTDILFGTGNWALTLNDFGNAHHYMNLIVKRFEPILPPRTPLDESGGGGSV